MLKMVLVTARDRARLKEISTVLIPLWIAGCDSSAGSEQSVKRC
jgi:hypothetical protein